MMKVVLPDPKRRFTDEFLEYVKIRLREFFWKRVDENKLYPFEIFINELPEYKSVFKKYITCYEICSSALYNIETLDTSYSRTLKISSTAILPGTQIRVEELCRLIDSGNLILKAYPIFTETFTYIRQNIEKLYAEYALGEVKDVHKTL